MLRRRFCPPARHKHGPAGGQNLAVPLDGLFMRAGELVAGPDPLGLDVKVIT